MRKRKEKEDLLEGMSRRRVLGTLAIGTGALVAARMTRALDSGSENAPTNWVSWDDGWAYPITGYTEDFWWIVEFDDGEWAVDPLGWVNDSGIWYHIVEIDAEGVWYSGDDGYDYLFPVVIQLEDMPLSV